MTRIRRSYVRPVEVGIPYVLVALALLYGAATVPRFLSSRELGSMSQTAAYIGIIAIGQTLVILIGGIDLSIPYAINLAAILLTGWQAANLAGAPDLAIVLLIGIAIGAVNGIGVAIFDVPPLVMTLGMNSVLEGVALLYSNGSPIGNSPGFVSTLATGEVAGIPYVVMVWAGLIAIVSCVLVFTRFGRYIYSIGASRRASSLSGLPVRRTIVAAYALSGLSAAFGGVLLAGYSGQAYLGMGDNYLLPSIAVVVIGGTSILGGKGSYVQTVAGALLITVIDSSLITLGQSGQDILYGSVILFMAYFFQLATSREGRVPRSVTGGLRAFSGWLQPVHSPKGRVTSPTSEPRLERAR